jgi:hypothetical protein
MFKLNYCHTIEAILVDKKESIYSRAKRNIYTFLKVESVNAIKDRRLRWLADLIGLPLAHESTVTSPSFRVY